MNDQTALNDRSALQAFRAEEARPDTLALARGRMRLLDHAAGAPSVRRAGLRPALRIGLAAGVTASVLGATLAVQGLTVGGTTIGASADAAEVLNRAAAAAAAAAAVPAPALGQFVYTHTIEAHEMSAMEGDDGAPAPDLAGGSQCVAAHEMWQPAATGVLRIRRADGITRESAANPGAPLQRDPNPACSYEDDSFDQPVQDGVGDWGAPDAEFVVGLPTNPSALYELARDDASDSDLRDDQTLTLLSDLAHSQSPYLTPAVRAAVFGAIARVPGVELGGTESNLFGELGTVVGRDEPGRRTRVDLILDPVTGEYLGDRRTAMEGNDSGLPAGTVMSELGARTTVVNAIGERPAT